MLAKKKILLLAAGIGLASAHPAYAEKLGEFMATLEAADTGAMSQKLYYFSGATDALMYANESLISHAGGNKAVCFPSPMPTREALYKLFLDHVDKLVKAGGMGRAAEMQVDQVIYASWMNAYPCRR